MPSRSRIFAALAVVVVSALVVAVVVTRDDPEPAAQAGPVTTTTPPPPEAEPHVEAVVTIDQRATDAALAVLDDGGTAADAAVTAAAVLSVVEPYYSNLIGGETAALYYDAARQEVRSLDGVGFVGEEFSLDTYRGGQPFGLDQALVPGSWDGWMVLLAEHGELGLDRLLRPAIELARDGHVATAELQNQVVSALGAGSINAAARAVYVPGGRAVRAGETVVQSDFAASLQGIADVFAAADSRTAGLRAARDHVYRGPLGAALTEAARAEGATFTAADMARFEATTGEAISLEYDDVTVHQTPPGTQGLTMLTALNTIEKADLRPEDAASPDAAHLVIEALKLAMADREEFVGDPAFTDVPVEALLSDDYGRQQLARIDPGSSIDAPIASGLDNTTTFQVVDAGGNAVAVTTSTGYQLQAAGSTGIMMNNRMRYMTATDPGSPNFLEPGKKVRYTGNPYIVTDADGALRLLGGTIGGDTQAQVQTQHVVNVLDFGLSAADAIARYRFVTQNTPGSIAPHRTPNQVRVETSTPSDVVDSLRRRGQNVSLQSGSGPFGYGTMVVIGSGGRSADLGVDPRVPTAAGVARPPG
ncbi:putative gamma-glutamyltransferase [Aeromicrobium marinum DSM 15272]|uniref:Gamma-glutamyltransferase n=1 Tax=Aeromicrobium marinum DSM 15272 TaxID=585531 RepID=E2SCJ4_9ACTN|nr:gamma-glutamyltransferase [Aeromicrobium marinum]EFQ82947.1 putative gamma-glutamyltransferase [Aeromicrobium marinum DSM 15272]